MLQNFCVGCIDDMAFPSGSAQAIQKVLNLQLIGASQYGMRFAPSKCKVFPPNWQEPMAAFIICGDH